MKSKNIGGIIRSKAKLTQVITGLCENVRGSRKYNLVQIVLVYFSKAQRGLQKQLFHKRNWVKERREVDSCFFVLKK